MRDSKRELMGYKTYGYPLLHLAMQQR